MNFKILLFLFLTINIKAEYRVYQYYIKARNPYSIDQQAHLVTSTLSPVGYLAYHGGEETLKIDLLRTWMCYGYTAEKPPCPPPLSVGNTSEGKN